MGVLAFSITIIPLVGPVLYWIVATVLALFTSPLSALIFAICYLIYIQIEAYVLTPKVMIEGDRDTRVARRHRRAHRRHAARAASARSSRSR